MVLETAAVVFESRPDVVLRFLLLEGGGEGERIGALVVMGVFGRGVGILEGAGRGISCRFLLVVFLLFDLELEPPVESR